MPYRRSALGRTHSGVRVLKLDEIELGGAQSTLIDTDVTLAANSDTRLPSQHAVVVFVGTAVAALVHGIWWLEPVIAKWDPGTGDPPTSNPTDRYIASATAGVYTLNCIYERTAGVWVETIPAEGYTVYIKTPDETETYNAPYPGGSWINTGYSMDHTRLLNRGTLTHADIDSYLNQSVKTTATPSFAKVNATGGVAGGDGVGDVVMTGGYCAGGLAFNKAGSADILTHTLQDLTATVKSTWTIDPVTGIVAFDQSGGSTAGLRNKGVNFTNATPLILSNGAPTVSIYGTNLGGMVTTSSASGKSNNTNLKLHVTDTGTCGNWTDTTASVYTMGSGRFGDLVRVGNSVYIHNLTNAATYYAQLDVTGAGYLELRPSHLRTYNYNEFYTGDTYIWCATATTKSMKISTDTNGYTTFRPTGFKSTFVGEHIVQHDDDVAKILTTTVDGSGYSTSTPSGFKHTQVGEFTIQNSGDAAKTLALSVNASGQGIMTPTGLKTIHIGDFVVQHSDDATKILTTTVDGAGVATLTATGNKIVAATQLESPTVTATTTAALKKINIDGGSDLSVHTLSLDVDVKWGGCWNDAARPDAHLSVQRTGNRVTLQVTAVAGVATDEVNYAIIETTVAGTSYALDSIFRPTRNIRNNADVSVGTEYTGKFLVNTSGVISVARQDGSQFASPSSPTINLIAEYLVGDTDP